LEKIKTSNEITIELDTSLTNIPGSRQNAVFNLSGFNEVLNKCNEDMKPYFEQQEKEKKLKEEERKLKEKKKKLKKKKKKEKADKIRKKGRNFIGGM